VHVLNFEADPRLATVFEAALDPPRVLRDLALLGGFEPAAALAGRALVFFDDIQACPRALTSLKYFAEQLPAAHIVAAGSLLVVELSRAASFPVGKVELRTLHPLDFAKHAPVPLVPRLAMLWDAIPGQLARENRGRSFIGGTRKPAPRSIF